jgi:Holliday junction resolvasome RuvABC endonuclease subunit
MSLSLDVSAASTGWCYTSDGVTFKHGTIVTKPKFTRAERLVTYNSELTKLLEKYSPTYIVIEDTFAGKNVKTLKVLSEFAGVTKFTCKKITGIDPYVISNHTVKAYFKVRTKESLFYFVYDIFDIKDLTFKDDNDILDALAQLMCYSQDVLNLYTFRIETDYGFKYYNKDLIEGV